MLRLALLATALAAGLTACGPTINLDDNIDLTWDFAPTLPGLHGTLHSPYVVGAKLTMFVSSSDTHQDLTGWTLVSSDPGVFAVGTPKLDSDSDFEASGTAVAPGTAELTVLDDKGAVFGGATVEVGVPDRLEVDAHGYLIVDAPDEAPVDELRVAEQGTATYMIRYFRGDQELYGNGVLAAQASAGVTATPLTSFLDEQREWLTVQVGAAGPATLALSASGHALPTPPLVVAPRADLSDVEIVTQSEQGHHDGDWLAALAQAYDTAGRRVFGIDYDWDVDGAAQPTLGDLYRYEYKHGANTMVTAQTGGMSGAAMIQSDAGFVDSSNRVGCSAAGAGGGPLLAFAALGLVAVRRRRRAA